MQRHIQRNEALLSVLSFCFGNWSFHSIICPGKVMDGTCIYIFLTHRLPIYEAGGEQPSVLLEWANQVYFNVWHTVAKSDEFLQESRYHKTSMSLHWHEYNTTTSCGNWSWKETWEMMLLSEGRISCAWTTAGRCLLHLEPALIAVVWISEHGTFN